MCMLKSQTPGRSIACPFMPSDFRRGCTVWVAWCLSWRESIKEATAWKGTGRMLPPRTPAASQEVQCSQSLSGKHPERFRLNTVNAYIGKVGMFSRSTNNTEKGTGHECVTAPRPPRLLFNAGFCRDFNWK